MAFHQHRASVLTDIVFAFPLLCIFRMIIVWHIQYVNIIIVRGAGPVIIEQEMTCQDPWWPHRESSDLNLTLMFVLSSDRDRGRSTAGEERLIGGVSLKQGVQQCAGKSLWGASLKGGHQSQTKCSWFLFWDVRMTLLSTRVQSIQRHWQGQKVAQFYLREKKVSNMVQWYTWHNCAPLW